MTPSAQDILHFWLEEVGEDGWYAGGEELDNLCRDRFQPAWEAAIEGRLGLWLTTPREALAYLILVDQLPRNMFRGTALAFASDPVARASAKTCINREWDLRVPEPERQFFYLPLEHSENLVDQDRSVRLFKARMPETGGDNLLHAIAHREQVRRFGRFPARNAALGRKSTPAEEAFLAEGGYGALVEQLRAARNPA